MSIRRTIDVQEGDDEWIEQYHKDVNTLCKMIHEMFITTPVVLLSPVFREMVSDRASHLKTKNDKVMHKLCVDNLGEPLNE